MPSYDVDVKVPKNAQEVSENKQLDYGLENVDCVRKVQEPMQIDVIFVNVVSFSRVLQNPINLILFELPKNRADNALVEESE